MRRRGSTHGIDEVIKEAVDVLPDEAIKRVSVLYGAGIMSDYECFALTQTRRRHDAIRFVSSTPTFLDKGAGESRGEAVIGRALEGASLVEHIEETPTGLFDERDDGQIVLEGHIELAVLGRGRDPKVEVSK